MEVAAIATQQAVLQMNTALSMIKQNAQSEQALVNMVAQAASNGRGQYVNLTV